MVLIDSLSIMKYCLTQNIYYQVLHPNNNLEIIMYALSLKDKNIPLPLIHLCELHCGHGSLMWRILGDEVL